MELFALSILLVVVPKLFSQQQCDSSSDLSQTEFVLIKQPPYDGYQWSTCLTDSEDYVTRASNERYQCYLSLDTQCWYQCMIYGVEEGRVNSDCSGCTPGDMLPNNLSRLAEECYSPRGDDCGWYENCLERRYPCHGTDDGYAIEYAQKFCNLYSDNYNDFSPVGRQWVDAVRQCLQVALVPSLRLWVTNTCAQIRDHAFATHSGCYTGVTPSMCELGCADIWRAFVIVNFPNGDFTEGALYTSPVATITQMLSVMRQCYTNEELSGCVKNLLTALEISVLFGITGPILPIPTTTFLIARHFDTVLNWVWLVPIG